MLADLVLGDNSLPDLYMAAFSVCAHMEFPQYMSKDREREQALYHLFLNGLIL